MQEICVDHSEVARLAELLEETPQVIMEAKQEAIAAVAPKMKAIVDQEIGGSGRVRSWQGLHIGSLGLYAAVRPRAKTYAEARKRQTWAEKAQNRYAVGYITNAINSGHRTPRNKWGYRTSAKVVSGQQFYQRALNRLDSVAEEVAESIGKTVTVHLSGGGKGRSRKKEPALYEQVTPAAGGVTSFTFYRRR